GFAYVVAWLVGLAIGMATSSPGPADSVSTLGAYFRTHREVAMIQAYLLDGIAGGVSHRVRGGPTQRLAPVRGRECHALEYPLRGGCGRRHGVPPAGSLHTGPGRSRGDAGQSSRDP